jgi:endoglucanase
MVSYLKTNGMSFAYWSFNPNSGDTGGLVADDWTTPQTTKLAALKPILTPSAITTPQPSTTPKPTTPKPSATPKPTPKPSATTPSSTGAAKVSAKWSLQNSWNAGYVANFAISSSTGAKKWTVTWPDSTVTSVVNAWGMTCTVVVKKSITCTGADWATGVTAGQTNTVGLQVVSTKAPVSPTVKVTATK